MKLREQVYKVAPTVPTASMADIAFLLVIFFMITTSFSPERTNVQLPESIVRAEVSDQPSIIAVTETGEIYFTSGEEPSVPLSGTDELGSLVQQIVELMPAKEFVIKADRNARYELVDGVLEALRSNGATQIGLLTRAGGEEIQ